MTFLFLTAVSTLFVCFDNKLVIDGKSEVAVKASLKDLRMVAFGDNDPCKEIIRIVQKYKR